MAKSGGVLFPQSHSRLLGSTEHSDRQHSVKSRSTAVLQLKESIDDYLPDLELQAVVPAYYYLLNEGLEVCYLALAFRNTALK